MPQVRYDASKVERPGWRPQLESSEAVWKAMGEMLAEWRNIATTWPYREVATLVVLEAWFQTDSDNAGNGAWQLSQML